MPSLMIEKLIETARERRKRTGNDYASRGGYYEDQ
jgi:hypothetical protein